MLRVWVRFGEGFAGVWEAEEGSVAGEGMLGFSEGRRRRIQGSLTLSLWFLLTGKKVVEEC